MEREVIWLEGITPMVTEAELTYTTSSLYWREQVNLHLRNTEEAAHEITKTPLLDTWDREDDWRTENISISQNGIKSEKALWIFRGHLLCNNLQVCKTNVAGKNKDKQKNGKCRFQTGLVIVWSCQTNVISFSNTTVFSRQRKYSVPNFSKTVGLVPCEKVSA